MATITMSFRSGFKTKWVEVCSYIVMRMDAGDYKLLSLIVALVYGYIVFCISSDKHSTEFKDKYGVAGTFLMDHGSGFVLISLAFIVAIQGVYFLASKYAIRLQDRFDKLQNDHIITVKVLETIKKVVLQKRRRFAIACQSFRSHATLTHRNVFNTITKPDDQIKLLIEGLEACLKTTYPNEFIKIALMRVNNGVLDGWELFYPEDTTANTTLAQLQDPSSTVSRCLALKRIVVVEDAKIEKDKHHSVRNCIPGQTDFTHTNWSILCYPIKGLLTNEVVYIISISIKKENVFTIANIPRYDWLLKFFDTRIALEHSLKELKGKIR